MTANEAVVAFIDSFEALGIPYMVVGGYAANHWGVARSTLDVDFVVEIANENLQRIRARLGAEYRLEPQSLLETVTATQRYIFATVSIPFKIELFLISDDPHDRARFARRIRVFAWTRNVHVATAEDLLIMKLRWSRHGARTKDVDDVKNLLGLHQKTLDWDYVHAWCETHGTRLLLDEIRKATPTI